MSGGQLPFEQLPFRCGHSDKHFLNSVSALAFRPEFPEMLVHFFNVVGDAGGNTRRLRFSDEEPQSAHHKPADEYVDKPAIRSARRCI